MPDLLVKRARLVTVVAWVVMLLAWAGLWHLGAKIEYWLFCWPTNAASVGWKDMVSIVQLAKFANIGLPIAAALMLPRHPRAARRIALAAILFSILLAVGLTIWVGSFYFQ